jgi:hypothetical protein
MFQEKCVVRTSNFKFQIADFKFQIPNLRLRRRRSRFATPQAASSGTDAGSGTARLSSPKSALMPFTLSTAGNAAPWMPMVKAMIS